MPRGSKLIGMLGAVAGLARALSGCANKPEPADGAAAAIVNHGAQGAGASDRSITLTATPLYKLQSTDATHPVAFSEAPRFARDGSLYWISVLGASDNQRIFKLDLRTGESVPIYGDATSTLAGLAVGKDGALYVADLGGGRLLRMSATGTDVTVLADSYEGTRLWPDDMVFDKNGNLYFTSFDGSLDQPTGGVYRWSSAGQLTRVTGGLSRPNGISLSPDGTQLWVGELQTNRVLRVPLLPDGTMDTSRLAGFAKVAANLTGGGADSNGVDSAGNVYQAELAAREFVMLDRYGKQIGSLQLPSLAAGDSVSNIVIKPGSRDRRRTGLQTKSGRLAQHGLHLTMTPWWRSRWYSAPPSSTPKPAVSILTGHPSCPDP
jgi:lactonase